MSAREVSTLNKRSRERGACLAGAVGLAFVLGCDEDGTSVLAEGVVMMIEVIERYAWVW